MAKIALALERALERRRTLGEPGAAVASVVARGDAWKVADVLCTSGPQDRPFEEQHTCYSIAVVLMGTFQYRCRTGHALMTPGSLMLGSPGQCFECGHEHAEGDRCVAFWYSADYFERLVSDAGHTRLQFRVPRIPPLRVLTPIVAAAGAGVTGIRDLAWDELAVELAVAAADAAQGAPAPYRAPLSAEQRATRIVRLIDQHPDAPLTLERMAREAGVSAYHLLRTFQRLTGTTPHQYILRARLREAAMRLAARTGTILDIALQCGFGDVSNFNRTFRAEFGLAPRAYQLRSRSASHPRPRASSADRRILQ